MNKRSAEGKAAATSSWQATGYVLGIYSLLAVFSLGLFGALHIRQDPDKAVGYLEVVGSVFFLLNSVFLQLSHKVGMAKSVFLFTVLLFLLLMLVTGGTAGTGIFWVFVFPVSAFFLTGMRGGILWMAVLFISMFAVWLLASNAVLSLPYTTTTLRQLGFSVLVVTIGICAYQRARELLESQSRESRDRLHAEKIRADVIVQNIAEGIVTTDAKGNITFLNPAAQKLLGWELKELFNKSFITMVPMLDSSGREVNEMNRPLYLSLYKGETVTMNAVYRRKNGSAIEVSVTGAPLMVGGKVSGVIGTFRDISEEQDVVRAKSEFVTITSHQLRTPLSAISWMSELLLNNDAGKLSDEQREHITAIYESNQRMSALVSEMLMVSGLDLHSLPVIPQKLNIKVVASGVVKEQLTAYAGRHPTLKETYDPELPPFMGDPEIMRIILRNLIANAIKYTPKSGRVEVRIALAPTRKLHDRSKGSIEVTISDSGYGIPKDATGRIFSKFFRARNIAHRDTDGTGLGLYIVKSLLSYVGGGITFHSEENKGTVFTVLLPLEGMTPYRPTRSAQLNSALAKQGGGRYA